jgi:hypothetical protein
MDAELFLNVETHVYPSIYRPQKMNRKEEEKDVKISEGKHLKFRRPNEKVKSLI